jgi:hypothetical protein
MMSVRKHLAGFAIFSVILGSAILINHFLTILDATIPPVLRPEATPVRVKEERQPVTHQVRQVSLDYINQKSYTELRLFRQLDQPAPDKVWVITTYFSPDSARAEDWTTTTEIHQPFARGNGQVFVATAEWDLPPALHKPGAGYFARVYVSSEYQGHFYEPDYATNNDIARAVPVVIHWPDKKVASTSTAKKFSR